MTVGRSWKLWAYRYKRSGKFMHIGAKPWVELHRLDEDLVPVLVEEILGDLYTPEVTHYGWQEPEGSRYRHELPEMIQIRCGLVEHDMRPERALMMLNMCFPYGLDAEIKAGGGRILALRITERPDDGSTDG